MPARRTVADEAKPVEIDGVITAHGLAALGRHLAWEVRGKIHITPAGHAMIGHDLRQKANAAIERGEHIWVRPPSAPLIGGTEDD